MSAGKGMIFVMNKADFHIHSYYSCDGEYSPQYLVKLAAMKGLKAIALTDHNTTEGISKFIATGKNYDIDIVPGIEIDTLYQKKIYHILGYYFDWESVELLNYTEIIKNNQKEYIIKVIDFFKQLDFKITYNDVLKYKNKRSIPGAVTVAEAIFKNKNNLNDLRLKVYLDKKDNDKISYSSFIRDYFLEEKSGVRQKLFSTKETINLILKLNGIPVLAHPGHYLNPDSKEDIQIIETFKRMGLMGIEAFSSYHNRKVDNRFYNIGKKLNFLITTGSDFHGRIKPNIEIGQVPYNSYALLKKLQKRM